MPPFRLTVVAPSPAPTAPEREVNGGGFRRLVAEFAIGGIAAPVLVAAIEQVEHDCAGNDRHHAHRESEAAALLAQEACTPDAASRPKAEPPDNTMASMPSTVCAGSSRAVSRVPGPPPRTSTLAVTGLSKTTGRDAGAELGIAGMADANARNIGDQIARHIISGERLLSRPITFRRNTPLRRLQAGALRGASRGPMNGEVTFLAALIAGLVSFLSPCVLPAGAAVSRVSGGHLARAFCGQGAGAAGQARNRGCGGSVRARLFHGVRGARRQRQRHRLAHPRLFGSACDHRRHCHCHHGLAFPSVSRRSRCCIGRSGSMLPSQLACGAPM